MTDNGHGVFGKGFDDGEWERQERLVFRSCEEVCAGLMKASS